MHTKSVVVPKQQMKQESEPADKHQLCVKIGKIAGETLTLLTLTYDEYATNKSSVSEWHRRFCNKTPCSEPASELYQPIDRRLSMKLVPTFADRGCRVVSVTDTLRP
jgi:hypothetical protein